MTTQAYIIQAGNRAGLILAGQDEYGEPEWMGNRTKFFYFERLKDFHENYGRFPNDDYPYREMEPNVYTK